MSTAELLAAFPEAAAALIEQGRLEERARVEQHLNFGAKCVSFDLAHQSIRSGETVTPMTVERYYRSIMSRRAIDARQFDSDEAGRALDGARPVRDSSFEDAVAREIERDMGPPPSPPTVGAR